MVAAATLGVCALAGCNNNETAPKGGTPTTAGAPSAGTKITIAWAQWKPSDYLLAVSKDFTTETGIAVDVQQIPWPQYQDKIQNNVWSAKSDVYDLIVGDSQWLGRGAAEGHYVDITDWAKTNIPWD